MSKDCVIHCTDLETPTIASKGLRQQSWGLVNVYSFSQHSWGPQMLGTGSWNALEWLWCCTHKESPKIIMRDKNHTLITHCRLKLPQSSHPPGVCDKRDGHDTWMWYPEQPKCRLDSPCARAAAGWPFPLMSPAGVRVWLISKQHQGIRNYGSIWSALPNSSVTYRG